MTTQTPVRLRLTISVEYEADPQHYGTSDPAQMAAIDQENFDLDMTAAVDALQSDDGLLIRVEPT